MTGSALQAMDVVVASWRKQKGGGLEEGGLKIHPGWRLADDGKRPSGDGRCGGDVWRKQREEVWRRGGSKSSRTGGWRMTGSALQAMDVVVRVLA